MYYAFLIVLILPEAGAFVTARSGLLALAIGIAVMSFASGARLLLARARRHAGRTRPMPELRVRTLTKHFSGVVAVTERRLHPASR